MLGSGFSELSESGKAGGSSRACESQRHSECGVFLGSVYIGKEAWNKKGRDCFPF